MRAVFLGTPEFAVPSLRALASHHTVVAVFTQPDRPKGRGNQVVQSAVKQAAGELMIPVHQPERVRRAENVELLRSLAADIMVVVGYGQIIPQAIIDLPAYGILNVHASLLPKYRGAAPIQWAIAQGETETGVTIMQIDAGLDTGDMLKKGTLTIGRDETAPELSARLAPSGASLLIETMIELAAGTAVAEKQNNAEATLAPILKKEDGLIDWQRDAQQTYHRFRGFNPWPGSYTSFRGQQLSVTGMRVAQDRLTVEPGQCVIHNRKWVVGCGGPDALEILEVQPAGKKRMTAAAFFKRLSFEAARDIGSDSLKIPLGFRFSSMYAGIRKASKDDVSLIVPDGPANAAAVFTTNVVQAAPVRLARKHLKATSGRVGAVLINAGNANCATRSGMKVAEASCQSVAEALKIKKSLVFPASTGVIGVELELGLLTKATPKLVENLAADKFEAVAAAILTTDTRSKTAFEEISFKRGTVRVAGMTKGSGMIHPNMATTLAFVMTDAAVGSKTLQRMLKEGTESSFNSLTVDGDMSTNDTLLLMASGASKTKATKKDEVVLSQAITRVLESLAQQIAADGEGARTLIIVRAEGFQTNEEARQVAKAIANSPLVKTAIGGRDPNWGRILSAAGYSGVFFKPSDIDIELQETTVCESGLAAEYDERALKQKLNQAEVTIRILNKEAGKGEARFFTCDLTEGYVQINGSYRT